MSAVLPTRDAPLVPTDRQTTSGVIAMRNLDAQIDGMRSRAGSATGATIPDQAALVDLLLLRSQLTSAIVDTEEAVALAELMVGTAEVDPVAYLTRARTRGAFHLFEAATRDLDHAAALGADPAVAAGESVGLLTSLGRYDEALAIAAPALLRNPSFQAHAGLAAIYAEIDEYDLAERHFERAQALYSGVSPFPVALLDFQRGHLWLVAGELERGRQWFRAAVARVPAFASAGGHLAEVDAELGNTAAAIERLVPLATNADDPDFADQLARVLESVDQKAQAATWRATAAARYDELVKAHPEAYADHAADFWLAVPSPDPVRALELASINLAVRDTRRARVLVDRARAAAANSDPGAGPIEDEESP